VRVCAEPAGVLWSSRTVTGYAGDRGNDALRFTSPDVKF